ncbi:TPA: ead/Ea22-like family protein [Klebsiella pneumoniae]
MTIKNDITELAHSLKAAAKKATPGQWVAFTDTASRTFSVHTPDDNRCGDVIKWAGFDGQRKAKANAEFIALANPANVIALVEALELKEEQRANWFQMAQKLGDDLDAAGKRIAELERGYENLRPVGVMSEKAYHRLENRESRFIALWPRPEIYLPRKRPEDGVIVYARTAASAGIKVETENIDADVSDRNQPGMVVAVHIDAGDFVKFRDQVYEVKETDFDDHDVTLWFVCGETLKCAAGCQIEVVTAPEEAE